MPRLTIAFVGQCHTVGYPGVPPDAAFPQVCREVIQAARPNTTVDVLLQPYYHPSELDHAVRSALRARPRVVILEVVGWLAVAGTRAVDLSRLPPGIRGVYQRVRHFRHLSSALMGRMPRSAGTVLRVATNADAIADGVLRPILPRYPRPTVAEYETCVVRALQRVASAPEVHAVIQGPGAPNLSLDARGLPADAVARYDAVSEMARRVADAHQALFVDRWATVTKDFFVPGSVRPTAGAHSVWGQLLASELLRAGVV